jgi:hypothetical protein
MYGLSHDLNQHSVQYFNDIHIFHFTDFICTSAFDDPNTKSHASNRYALLKADIRAHLLVLQHTLLFTVVHIAG